MAGGQRHPDLCSNEIGYTRIEAKLEPVKGLQYSPNFEGRRRATKNYLADVQTLLWTERVEESRDQVLQARETSERVAAVQVPQSQRA